jgi:nucleoside-diphosphate-sugar epimerase
MRVFVTGASGAIGSRLVPQLIDAGYEVTGSHNSPASAELLRTLGAKPVMLDLLDAAAVRKAVLEAEPDAIVHEATALAKVKFSRNMDKVTAKTSELRTKGTDALLAAGRARPACADSLRKALPASPGTLVRADRSRRRTIRSTPHRRRTSTAALPR